MCVCVFVDVCVVSITLSLLVLPPPFSSRLACYPLAWGRVWQRDNPCRYVPLTPRCSCLLRILGELGRLPLSLPLSLSLRPSFSSATNIPADICFPSSLQSLWCLLGRHIRAQGVWKWFDLPLWKLHYLGHSPTLGLRGVMLDLRRCVKIRSVIDTRPHWLHLTQTGTAPVLRNVHPCDKSEDKQRQLFQSHCICLSVLVVQVSSW